MEYELVNVSPSAGQIAKVAEAMENNEPVALYLNPEQMKGGNYPLMLTPEQRGQMLEAYYQGEGCGLSLSPEQLTESLSMSELQGSGWFDILGTVVKTAAPYVVKGISSLISK